jgi:two-component system, OmpR family, sensor histidine kinase TctE
MNSSRTGRDTPDYGVMDINGRLLLGDRWLPTVLPSTQDAEFLSVVEGGITFRVVAQRSQTAAGELIIMLADGSDARQQWLDTVLTRVVLPNLLLMLVAAVAVTWAVSRALRPLIDLKEAVERRSPRDLNAIEAESAPAEVRPLVSSLNRLFSLVNDQTQAQRRFVADAAHQLRTPLAGLQAQVEAWAQAARSMGATDQLSLRVEQVHRLRDATRRTSQLANQLLALSRADSMGSDSQPKEQVDLTELCENILAIYLDAASDKQMDLGLEVAPAQTPRPRLAAARAADQHRGQRGQVHAAGWAHHAALRAGPDR